MAGSFTRRDFCRCISQGFCTVALLDLCNPLPVGAERKASLKEVSYYKKLPELKIQCQICPKECEIADLERGYCGNKENRKGMYYSLVYGQSCAAHIDPIEKKPLFHYLPSTAAFSV
ncbi:MAG: radical SAM protein, partial [Thermodesulfobacteriota bacterium]|nr:radical SAM protein [Thermodesulfobacteriota bacterium]